MLNHDIMMNVNEDKCHSMIIAELCTRIIQDLPCKLFITAMAQLSALCMPSLLFT